MGIHGTGGKPRVDLSAALTLSSIELQEGDVLIGLGSEDQLGKLKVRTEKS